MKLPADKKIQTLASGVRESNRQSFNRLFRALYPQLVTFVYQYTHDKDTASDVVQDVFTDLWQMRERIDPAKSIKAFLYKSVKNRALNQIRDYSKKTTFLDTKKIYVKQDTGMPNSDNYKQLSEKIDEWITLLPDRQREAFELSRFEGLDHEEIAEVMAVSENTVNNHIVSALKKLRAYYDQYQNEMN